MTFDEVLRRGVARDRAFRGSAAEAERRYLTKYIPGEQRYLDEIRPRDRADVVITNEDPADPGIEIARG